MSNIVKGTGMSEESRYHQFYGVPFFSSIVVFLVNIFIALFNPVTTYCIADSITRRSSRFVEICVIILFFFSVVLLSIKKGYLFVIFLNSLAIGLQFSLLGYIARVNKMEMCYFISRIWASIGSIIALVGAIVNIGILYFNYLRSHPKKSIYKIVWQLIGAMVFIVIVSILFFIALDWMFGI